MYCQCFSDKIFLFLLKQNNLKSQDKVHRVLNYKFLCLLIALILENIFFSQIKMIIHNRSENVFGTFKRPLFFQIHLRKRFLQLKELTLFQLLGVLKNTISHPLDYFQKTKRIFNNKFCLKVVFYCISFLVEFDSGHSDLKVSRERDRLNYVHKLVKVFEAFSSIKPKEIRKNS